MPTEKNHLHPSRANHKPPPGLLKLSDPKMREHFRKKAEEIRNRPEPAPTLEEIRAIWDRALGDRTTEDLMNDIRGKPFPDRPSKSSE